jgi:hypothetical protein
VQQQQPGYVWATFSALNGTLYDAEFAFADNDAVVSVWQLLPGVLVLRLLPAMHRWCFLF